MSTKLLCSLTDEKADMQKQLGCMNGIFQLFGRASDHNHKRLPPGTCQNHGMEQKYIMETLPVKEKKLMATVELSRASFSSSCSSSTSSSADWNKRTQSELSSSCHSNFPEPSSSSHLSRKSFDLRDIVKDSICKEAQGLSVKTKRKEEKAGPAIRHIDSPRPLQLHKHIQPKGTRRDASLQVLPQLQDGGNPDGEKFGSLPLPPQDTPRYSYDERVSPDKLKSTTKLKELPRLSLDSRVRPVRSSAYEYRTNYLSKEDREARNSNQILFENQEPGSNKKPSMIVARLMGFEPTRDSIPTDGQMIKVKSCLDEVSETISPSLKIRAGNRQNIVSGSPKGCHKKSVSPTLKKESMVTDSASGSTFPLKPVSYRQTDNNHVSQKQSLSYQEAHTKPPLAPPSVYSEIKKRLNELEFITAGKDLRALKQIIEAMEKTRELSDNNKIKEQGSSNRNFDYVSTEWRKHNTPVSPSKGSYSPKNHGTQIVKRKPPNVNDNPAITINGKSCQRTFWLGEDDDDMTNFLEKQTAKQITRRNNCCRDSSSWPLFNMEGKKIAETIRSVHHPKASQQTVRENPASFRKSSQKLSPRLQHKKHGMEKLSNFTNQPSVKRMSRAHLQNQPTEAGSPRKLKPKSASLQTRHDQISRSTTHTTNMNRKGDTGSMQSGNAIDLAAQNDKERENKSADQLNGTSSTYKTNNPNKEDFTAKYSEDRLISESTTTQEQPSPVSVLNITLFEEDISPVKKISMASKDNSTLSCIDEGSAVYTDNFKKNKRSNSSSGIDQREVDHLDHLVHKVGLVNTSQDRVITNQIKLLTNPDYKYIAQILSTAGLLIFPGSCLPAIQIHPAEITVNPDLFHILEKATGLEVEDHDKDARSKQKGKMQRKLVFDAVNEILACKHNHLQGALESRISCNKNGEKIMTGEELLEDLCRKLDHQQAAPYGRLDDKDEELTSILRAEMMDQHEGWAGHSSQLPEIVLDIERMIYKDLVGEVVSGFVFPQQCSWDNIAGNYVVSSIT